MNTTRKRLSVTIILIVVILVSSLALVSCNKSNNANNNNNNDHNNNNNNQKPISYQINEEVWNNVINYDFLVNNQSSYTINVDHNKAKLNNDTNIKKDKTTHKKQGTNHYFYFYENAELDIENTIENFFEIKNNSDCYIYDYTAFEDAWIKQLQNPDLKIFETEQEMALCWLSPIFNKDEELPFTSFTFNDKTNEYEKTFELIELEVNGRFTQLTNLNCKIKFANNNLEYVKYESDIHQINLEETYGKCSVVLDNINSTNVILPSKTLSSEQLQVDNETWTNELNSLLTNNNFTFETYNGYYRETVKFDNDKIFNDNSDNYYLLKDKIYQYSQLENTDWVKEEISNENYLYNQFVFEMAYAKDIINFLQDKFNENTIRFVNDCYSFYQDEITLLNINGEKENFFDITVEIRFKDNKIKGIYIGFSSIPYNTKDHEYWFTNINSTQIVLPIA